MAAAGTDQGATVVANLCCDCAVCATNSRSRDSSHCRFVASCEWPSTARVVAVRLAGTDPSATTRRKRRDEKYPCEWRDKRRCSLRRSATFDSGRAAELPSVRCAALSSSRRCGGALYLLRSRKHRSTRPSADEEFADASRFGPIESRRSNECADQTCQTRQP